MNFADKSPNPGDVLAVKHGDGKYFFLEAVKGKKNALKFLCQGEMLELRQGEFVSNGYHPRLSESWVKKTPTLVESLEIVRKSQKKDAPPSELLQRVSIEDVELVTCLPEFENMVQENPAQWCDGTGPHDEPLNEIDQNLLTAGELIALSKGYRGVCLLQTSFPIDTAETRLPLLRPFVLTLLRNMVESKDLVVYPSSAAGGAATSLVISAKRQPFKAWGAYLASIGAQASVVAESEFYKLVIGRMMGYKEENIEHHITSNGGLLTPKIRNLVDLEMKELSDANPSIPWQ